MLPKCTKVGVLATLCERRRLQAQATGRKHDRLFTRIAVDDDVEKTADDRAEGQGGEWEEELQSVGIVVSLASVPIAACLIDCLDDGGE